MLRIGMRLTVVAAILLASLLMAHALVEGAPLGSTGDPPNVDDGGGGDIPPPLGPGESAPRPPVDPDVAPPIVPDDTQPETTLFRSVVNEQTLTVPSDLSQSILYESESHDNVAIAKVDVDADAPVGTQAEPGVGVFLETATDTSTLVFDLSIAGGTGFSIMEVLSSSQSPESFSYQINLDDGYGLVMDEQGGLVLVRPDESRGQVLAPPWAFDSAGNAIPVRYEIDGQHLVMHVSHRELENITYPVIADPCWSCIKKAVIGAAKLAGGVAAGTAAFAAGAVAVLTYNPAAAVLVIPLARVSVALVTSGFRDLRAAGDENRR